MNRHNKKAPQRKQGRQTENVYLFESKIMEKYIPQGKILFLVLTNHWFEMIAAGTKKTEYRETSDYWSKRLLKEFPVIGLVEFKEFDVVVFTNGYSNKSPRLCIECKGITIGTGRNDWGAIPGKQYFKIQLGKILHLKK